ncbi:MAG: hypothetical protein ACE5MG_10430, partial [Candidatus Methylomirabilales bacterium]
MRARVILAGTCVGGPAIACALFRAAEAHEKWFIDPGPYPLRAGQALAEPLTWVAIGGPIVLWAVAMLLWRRRDRRPFVPGPGDIGGRP